MAIGVSKSSSLIWRGDSSAGSELTLRPSSQSSVTFFSPKLANEAARRIVFVSLAAPLCQSGRGESKCERGEDVPGVELDAENVGVQRMVGTHGVLGGAVGCLHGVGHDVTESDLVG
jgi:hypothetical protein